MKAFRSGPYIGLKVRMMLAAVGIIAGVPTASAIGQLGGGDAPLPPTGLTGPASDIDGTYAVSWNSSSGADFYDLREKIGSGTWSIVYSGTLRSLTFSKESIESYTYRVRACSYIDGCGLYSVAIVVNVTGGIVSPSVEETSSLDVGTTAYGVDVASDGDAVVSVPIEIVPGVAGFAPALSLEYDSGRGIDRLERSLPEDTVGYGWRLAGLSQIRRCVVNQTSGASIHLNNSDSLCLDGMPLVLATGTHFAAGATYRTLIESYVAIKAKVDSTGLLWFEATLPDGTVRRYGTSKGSRVDKNGGVEYQWSLSQETSVDGNTINYTYWFDPSDGVNYILKIEYAGAVVDFEYLARSESYSRIWCMS